MKSWFVIKGDKKCYILLGILVLNEEEQPAPDRKDGGLRAEKRGSASRGKARPAQKGWGLGAYTNRAAPPNNHPMLPEDEGCSVNDAGSFSF